MPTNLKDLKNIKDLNKLKEMKIFKDLNVDRVKEKLDHFVTQAKESLKVLETLEKEGLLMVKSFIKDEVGKDVAKKTKEFFKDEKIKKNLHKIGLATLEEVKELEKKFESVSSELKQQFAKVKKNKPNSTNKQN